MDEILYKTRYGKYIIGDSLKLLANEYGKKLKGKVQLIITSPPFPLNKKKKYGNLLGEEYKEWLAQFAIIFSDLLKEDGSIVMEMGNSWEPNRPVQSLLHLESLIEFKKRGNLNLCQQFICYNPSRLPSPAAWVTVNRIRTIDSFTHVWWMSKSDYPKADNKKVLRPYSKSMEKLLKNQKYNAGLRPSEHRISETSFLKRHGGSIMHNFIELDRMDEDRDPRLPNNVLSFANTNSNDQYLQECRKRGIKPHPARMPPQLVSFFMEFLTEPGDLVLDPFAGSNTTGYIAEKLKRKWIGFEIDEKYGQQSMLRFGDKESSLSLLKKGNKSKIKDI